MWRHTRDVALPLVGMRAVMLQIAHPAVASAGVRNSRFREEFLPRARRTFSWRDLPLSLEPIRDPGPLEA
jgi:uncharacterized protein (DUF2236 family)